MEIRNIVIKHKYIMLSYVKPSYNFNSVFNIVHNYKNKTFY